MDEIRTTACSLLTEGTVRAVIGYAEGTIKGKTRTLIAQTPEEAERFIFNEYCTGNLSVTLTRQFKNPKEGLKPVGIFVKACDSRTVNSLIQEQQIRREDVFVIGLNCKGVTYYEDGGIAEKCKACKDRTPLNTDIVIGEKPDEAALKEQTSMENEKLKKLQELEAMSLKERWEFWSGQFEKCIRCYACRQVCPMCYCNECIADKSRPGWIDTSAHAAGNLGWHLIRAFHLAGRCTGCNECEKACHQNIPLGLLNIKMSREVFSMFGYRAGVDADSKPPLTEYRLDDNEDFIL